MRLRTELGDEPWIETSIYMALKVILRAEISGYDLFKGKIDEAQDWS